MAPQYTRADSLREYLTGAAVDGDGQADPALSFGLFRSSVEALSVGIVITNALPHVTVLYASGGNPPGTGLLQAADASTLRWQAPGDTDYGPPCNFTGVNDVEVVEGSTPGKHLRVQATPPFAPNVSQITLSYLTDNVFGMSDLSISQAAAGQSQYRVTLLKNVSSFSVTAVQRWLSLLGNPQPANGGGLAGTGPGTISTAGQYSGWPASGWCQVRNSSGGTIKEVIYYSSRTGTTLNVPAYGRGLFGTTPQVGAVTDYVYPVPGVVLGLDPTSPQVAGGVIQQQTDIFTPPVGVTWNMEVTASGGLQVGTLLPGQQAGVWLWRQAPPGINNSPFLLTQLLTGWNAF